jgi:hypothetical protein
MYVHAIIVTKLIGARIIFMERACVYNSIFIFRGFFWGSGRIAFSGKVFQCVNILMQLEKDVAWFGGGSLFFKKKTALFLTYIY